jgi:hypothetical protein
MDCSVASSCNAPDAERITRPLDIAGHFPGQDWRAELAQRSGRSRDNAEWHLQQDTTPPTAIGDAARAMLATNSA